MGVASTTHVDRNNDKMTKEYLEGMAEQIREKIIPLLIEHDWRKQIGVILYGEVFQMRDEEYALGTISAIFEGNEEKEKFKVGEPNTNWLTYQNYFDVEEVKNATRVDSIQLKIMKNFDRDSNDDLNEIAKLLEEYFSKNNIRREDGKTYVIKAHIASHKGMEIVIHSNDHTPPHFHVISIQRGFNARFCLETQEFISNKFGDISGNEKRAIKKFFQTEPNQIKKLKATYKKFYPDL